MVRSERAELSQGAACPEKCHRCAIQFDQPLKELQVTYHNKHASKGTASSQKAFNALRLIVTIGWAIYPIGYVLGYTGGGSAEGLNIIYNLADFVNKIAFGVVIWAAATSESK